MTTECDGSGEAEIMEKAAAAGARKRKLMLGGSELSTNSVDQFKTRRLAVSTPGTPSSPVSLPNSTCDSVNSGPIVASCGSSSRMSELAMESIKSVDLEWENELTVEFFAISAGNSVNFSDGREKSPSSKDQADSGELASTARLYESNTHRCSTADKMPSHAEIEEFFAAAEKNLQKQFIDKYNYDIVKDEPTEGRYEWVRLNSTKAMVKKAKNGDH